MVRTRIFAWVGTAGGKHGIETLLYLGVESASKELDKLSRRLAKNLVYRKPNHIFSRIVRSTSKKYRKALL